MSSGPIPPPDIAGVLFDFHSTLVDQGQPDTWLRRAWQATGRAGDPQTELDRDTVATIENGLDRIWEHAAVVDPGSRRDLSVAVHREVYDTISRTVPGLDQQLAAALYETMLEVWVPYRDTLPTLRAQRTAGLATAVVSNIGLDVRGLLARTGLADLLDAVVLSYEVGVVKPDPGIFATALDRIGVAPQRALMVGDSWRADSGAAQLGIRTLILPRTSGPVHGLAAVLHLTGRRRRSAPGSAAASTRRRRSPGRR